MFREKIKNIKQEIKNIKGQIELHQDQKMLQPNVPLETVPKGANEKDNLFHETMVYPVRETGVHHGDMGLIDFDRGRKLQGLEDIFSTLR